MKILITGGTGMLGQHLVRAVLDAGYSARVMSRRSRPQTTAPEVEWVQADIVSGDGVPAAVD